MILFLTHCFCAAVFKIGFLHASILKVLDDKKKLRYNVGMGCKEKRRETAGRYSPTVKWRKKHLGRDTL